MRGGFGLALSRPAKDEICPSFSPAPKGSTTVRSHLMAVQGSVPTLRRSDPPLPPPGHGSNWRDPGKLPVSASRKPSPLRPGDTRKHFWGKIPFKWVTSHQHMNSSSNSTALRHKQYTFVCLFFEEGEEEGRPGVDVTKTFTCQSWLQTGP